MRKIVLAVIGCFVVTAGLSAVQAKPEAVYGTVRDSSGHVLSDVQIILENKSKRVTRRATTNDAGEYRIEVPFGSYVMWVTYKGIIKDKMPDGLRLNANETLKKDITLTIPDQKPSGKGTPPQRPKGPLPEGSIPTPR